jgi:hypothetical protein
MELQTASLAIEIAQNHYLLEAESGQTAVLEISKGFCG